MTNCENNCHYNGLCIDGKCDCFYGWDRASNCGKIDKNIGEKVLAKFSNKNI